MILVPVAVWREVALEGVGYPGAAEVGRAPWIQVQPVRDQSLLQALQQDLGTGEAEAIALALETRAELLLMNDRMGRGAARRLSIPTLGLVGVCLEAKTKGLIPTLKLLLNDLRSQAGFRLGAEVYAQVLRDAGEA